MEKSWVDYRIPKPGVIFAAWQSYFLSFSFFSSYFLFFYAKYHVQMSFGEENQWILTFTIPGFNTSDIGLITSCRHCSQYLSLIPLGASLSSWYLHVLLQCYHWKQSQIRARFTRRVYKMRRRYRSSHAATNLIDISILCTRMCMAKTQIQRVVFESIELDFKPNQWIMRRVMFGTVFTISLLWSLLTSLRTCRTLKENSSI